MIFGATTTQPETATVNEERSDPWKKVLITGGFGFIGYALAKHILETDKDAHVTMLGHREAPEHVRALAQAYLHRCETKVMEVRDIEPEDFMEVVQVYHLAAMKTTTGSIQGSEAMLENVCNDDMVVQAFGNRPGVKFLYASTGEVLGPMWEKIAIEGVLDWPVRETGGLASVNVYDPQWMYAAAKIVTEMGILHGALTSRWTIARLASPYGPHMGDKTLLPTIVKASLDEKATAPTVFMNDTRPFLFIDDVVRALRMIMDSAHTDARVVNVCGPEKKVEDMIGSMIHGCGDTQLRFVPRDREAHMPNHRRALQTQVLEELGWRPWVDLDEGVRRTFEHYREKFGG